MGAPRRVKCCPDHTFGRGQFALAGAAPGRFTGRLPSSPENAMKLRTLAALTSLAALAAAAWLGGRGKAERKPDTAWVEVLPGVWRSPGQPAGYALVSGTRALLIDAPVGPEGLRGARTIDGVLLTHHHRDGLAA